MHNGGDIQAFDIVLSYAPGSLSIDDLVEAYFTNTKNKSILDDPSVLIKIVHSYGLNVPRPLTFQRVIEAANKAFLGKGAIKFYTPFRCTEENAKMGNLELLQYFVEVFFEEEYNKDPLSPISRSFELILEKAAENNDLNMLKYTSRKYSEMCKLSPQNKIKFIPRRILCGASSGGHLDLIKFTEIYYDVSPDVGRNIAYLAALKGHLNIVKYASEHADIIHWCLVAFDSARGGHLDVFMYSIFSNVGVLNWNTLLQPAAEGGNSEILKIVLSNIAQVNWNSAAYGALIGGHRDLYDLAIAKGANNWEMIANGAIKGGNVEVLRFALDRVEIEDIDELLCDICENEDTLRVLHEYCEEREGLMSTRDWFQIYELFEQHYGNKVIMSLLKEWYPTL